MKVKKINLPDEIEVKVEDARFIFDRPSNLDQFDFPDAFRAKEENENFAKFFSHRIKYALAKLKRVEGLSFEDDGKAVGKVYFKDLSTDLQVQVTTGFIEKVFEYFSIEAEPKKELEPSA